MDVDVDVDWDRGWTGDHFHGSASKSRRSAKHQGSVKHGGLFQVALWR